MQLTLRLDRVTVDSCQGGGILLDGAAFDIRNTTRHAATALRQAGATAWGGILVNALAAERDRAIALVHGTDERGGSVSPAGLDRRAARRARRRQRNTPVQSYIATLCGISALQRGWAHLRSDP